MEIKKGTHVVIYAETRKEWILTAIACFKLGLPSLLFIIRALISYSQYSLPYRVQPTYVGQILQRNSLPLISSYIHYLYSPVPYLISNV